MPKQVAKKENTEVAALSYFEQYEGMGVGATTEEMSLPFLRIIEALSPQLKKKDPEFHSEAETGDIINTVTKELWSGDQGVPIIPCYKTLEYPMFKTRESGGGFVKMGNDDIFRTSERDDRGRNLLSADPSVQIVRAGTTYVLVLDIAEKTVTPAIVSCSNTRLRAWKDWNTQINFLRIQKGDRTFQPPLFGVVWNMTTQVRSNEQGEWHVPLFSPHPEVEGLIGGIGGKFNSLLLDENLAQQGYRLQKSVSAGEAKVNYQDSGDAPAKPSQTSQTPDVPLDDDSLPF